MTKCNMPSLKAVTTSLYLLDARLSHWVHRTQNSNPRREDWDLTWFMEELTTFKRLDITDIKFSSFSNSIWKFLIKNYQITRIFFLLWSDSIFKTFWEHSKFVLLSRWFTQNLLRIAVLSFQRAKTATNNWGRVNLLLLFNQNKKTAT